ncbi:hypothetical protein V2J09_005353 [Rumex salicifolius]
MAFLRHARKIYRAFSLSPISQYTFVHPSIRSLVGSSNSSSCNFQTFRRTHVLHYSTSVNQPCFFSNSHYSPLKGIFSDELNGVSSEKNVIDELGIDKLIEVVNRAKGFEVKSEAIAFLDTSGVIPSQSIVNLAILELRDCWELALLVFEWGEKWGCNNERTLGLIVWVLGTYEKFSVAWCLIRDAHRSSLSIKLPMLVMIERYAAKNSPQKAIKTFDMLENLRLSPDQNAFYTLLHALCENGNAAEAEELMLTYKKLFPLETESFNIILNAYCNLSVDILEAKRVWREMLKNCITPDSVTYTYMISCISKVKNLFDSLRLYDEMKKRGWTPGLEVYNSLIYVLTCENCLKEALKIMEKIKEEGLQPDVESYNSLICPLCEANRFDEARTILCSMMQENINPTGKTYYAFLQSDSFESILEVLNQIKRAGLGPDKKAFLFVFSNFFKLSRPESALKIWVQMRDYGVEPESEHYVTVVEGLIKCGCLAKAKELYTEMISKGFVDEPKLKRLLQEPRRIKHHQRDRPFKIVRRVKRDTAMNSKKHAAGKGRKRGGKRKKKNAIEFQKVGNDNKKHNLNKGLSIYETEITILALENGGTLLHPRAIIANIWHTDNSQLFKYEIGCKSKVPERYILGAPIMRRATTINSFISPKFTCNAIALSQLFEISKTTKEVGIFSQKGSIQAQLGVIARQLQILEIWKRTIGNEAFDFVGRQINSFKNKTCEAQESLKGGWWWIQHTIPKLQLG